MKKFLYSLIALAGLMTAASCQPDKLVGGPAGANDGTLVDATFSVSLGTATKAFASGDQANKLYAGLYKVVSGGYEYVADTKVAVSGLKAQVVFEKGLKRGESYKVVFWAQHEADGFTPPYTVVLNSATPTITVATSGSANDDLRDAFYGVYETGTVTTAVTIEEGDSAIKLKRPFAQINILVHNNNIDNTSPTTRTSLMTVAGAPNVLNLLSGVASGSETYSFTSASISEAAFGTFAADYQYMAMNYVLPAQDGNSTYTVTFSVTNDSQSVADKQVTLPLKPNVRTNIVGNIFDENFDFSAWAVIKPEAGELTTINLNVGTAGESSTNPVTLAGAGATASVTPIISRDVTGETPTITVEPSSIADAVWVPAVAADPNAVPPVAAVPAHVQITAKANGTATVTVVFDAITKTAYAEGRFTFYIDVTGVTPQKLDSPVLDAQNAVADENSIILDWEDVANATSYAVTYKVKDAEGDASVVTPAPTGSEVTISGLTAETTYTITVQALADGFTASDVATINVATEAATPVQKQNQTLTFAHENEYVTLGESYTLQTVSGAQTAVTYTSSNTDVATIDGTTVTLVAAGETTVTATAAADETYNEGSASYTLTVSAAPVQADFTTIAELKALTFSTAKEYTGTLTDAVVSFVPATNTAIIKDATGSMMLYKANHGLLQGQTISGEVTVTTGQHNGANQITALTATVSGSETTVSPETVTLAALAANYSLYENAYVKVEGVTSKTTANANNSNVTGEQNGTEYIVFTYKAVPVNAGDVFTAEGTVTCYNDTKELKVWAADDLTVTQAAPVLSATPATKTVNASDTEVTWTITSNTDWTIILGDGVYASATSGNGDGDVTLTFAANTGTDAKTLTATASATGCDDVTITITQNGTGTITTDYSTIETSNVTLTGGTNGSEAQVNGEAAIKVGTAKLGGDMSVTVPAGTTKLHVHAAAWNGVTGLSLNLSGATCSPASISLTADSGIANNSPFTLSGAPEDFYFEVTLSGIETETTIKFTSSSAKRFVVWGVNAE